MNKLPPGHILAALIRFGFRTGDIADRFDTSSAAVSQKKRRMGLEMIPSSAPERMKRNGARPASRYFG